MHAHGTRPAIAALRRRWPVNWLTVALFALVLALTDGFWVTSLQGAVGAIERNQPPFPRWLHDSAIMLPLFALAVAAALALGHRWTAGRGRLLRTVGTAMLVVGLGTVVAVAEVSVSAAYDYHLQAEHLKQSPHLQHATPAAVDPGVVVTPDPRACTGACAATQATLHVHERAVGLASVLLLLTNLVLVTWLMVLRGDRLWTSTQVTEPGVPEPRRDGEAVRALI